MRLSRGSKVDQILSVLVSKFRLGIYLTINFEANCHFSGVTCGQEN